MGIVCERDEERERESKCVRECARVHDKKNGERDMVTEDSDVMKKRRDGVQEKHQKRCISTSERKYARITEE